MKIPAIGMVIAWACLSPGNRVTAAEIKGRVENFNLHAVSGARILLRTQRGTEYSTTSDPDGRFRISGVQAGNYQVLVLRLGYRSHQEEMSLAREDSAQEILVKLSEGGISDEVVVTASLVDLPQSRTPSAVSVLDRGQIEARRQTSLVDVMRYATGVQVNQTGRRGASTGLFIRGGESDFNQVLVDGVQVNDFGGNFDLSQLSTSGIERIEVLRGPQSALYGSDAISGVVNIITRRGTRSPSLELLAEGGSFAFRRLSAHGQGAAGRWLLAGGASHQKTNGLRTNDDFQQRTLSLNLSRPLGNRQEVELQYLGTDSEVGSPGPYGSNPLGIFEGLDLVSRNRSGLDTLRGLHRMTWSDRFQHQIEAQFSDSRFDFTSPYGPSRSQNGRGALRLKGEWVASPRNLISFGFEYERENFLNTYVTDDHFQPFRMHRANQGFVLEDLLTPGSRWLVSLGLRIDRLGTQSLPGSQASGRPPIDSRLMWAANPRIAVSYDLRQEGAGFFGRSIIRSSLGRGMRAPGGFELAFTDNPALNPETSRSVEMGFEQQFLKGRGRLQSTVFFHRFDDLIVTLGGSATPAGRYKSDNLSNARARGIEVEGRWDLPKGFGLGISYTHLESRILGLDGSPELTLPPFQVGQPLLRRPSDSGSFFVSWRHGRWAVNWDGYARSWVLDVEPNLGASGGLYRNPGYWIHNVGLEFRISRALTAYVRLNNAGNCKYEESFGYPSMPLNFLGGLQWNLPLARN